MRHVCIVFVLVLVLVSLFIQETFSSDSQIGEGEAAENDQLLFAHVVS